MRICVHKRKSCPPASLTARLVEDGNQPGVRSQPLLDRDCLDQCPRALPGRGLAPRSPISRKRCPTHPQRGGQGRRPSRRHRTLVSLADVRSPAQLRLGRQLLSNRGKPMEFRAVVSRVVVWLGRTLSLGRVPRRGHGLREGGPVPGAAKTASETIAPTARIDTHPVRTPVAARRPTQLARARRRSKSGSRPRPRPRCARTAVCARPARMDGAIYGVLEGVSTPHPRTTSNDRSLAACGDGTRDGLTGENADRVVLV